MLILFAEAYCLAEAYSPVFVLIVTHSVLLSRTCSEITAVTSVAMGWENNTPCLLMKHVFYTHIKAGCAQLIFGVCS